VTTSIKPPAIFAIGAGVEVLEWLNWDFVVYTIISKLMQ
jgi:hypothetical protein